MGVFRALLALSLATGSLCQSSSHIQVTKNATHAIPSTLYGYMWEDINHSGDGGLYGELLQNRAFQAVVPHTTSSLAGWTTYKNTKIEVTNSTAGVSSALPNSLQVTVPTGLTGPVGFENTGYWGEYRSTAELARTNTQYTGIKVQKGWKYTGSFYAKSSGFTGPLTVSLVSSSSGQVYATKTLKGVSSSWKKLSFEFQPTTSAASNDNVLRVAVDGASAAGKTLYFGMFSLFPPTYKNRPNGMRIDLAEAMAGTNPGVWRFPGGNNLEGMSIDSRWKWNETIGPLETRPGRFANWGYPNTDGLGLMEYLNWAEDLGAEIILGVWAGLAIGDYANLSTFPVVPDGQLGPYVQEVIDEIHFITGDAKTNEWAKLRAKYGRAEPYKLKYIEIGNEDFFGVETYVKYRWRTFVDGIKAAFPDSGFEYLATTLPDTALTPAYTYLDFHQYNTPEWFIERAVQYDTYPRNGTHLFIGEYAVTSTNASCLLGEFSCGRLEYPTLRGAVAEAAYMTGLERNSDVIFASAYAPSLQNINGWQWTPDIITFDAGKIVKSASYYVQQMFGANIGTHVLTTSPTPSPSVPLYWVASHDAKNKVVYLKVSNTANTTYTASFAFDFPLSSATLTLLSAPISNSSNTLGSTDVVVPKTSKLPVRSGATGLNYTFPAYSVGVFNLKVNW